MSLADIILENVIWGALFLLPWLFWLSVLVLLVVACVPIWYFNGAGYKSKRYMKLAENAFTNAKFARAAKYCEAALECDEILQDAYIMLAHIAMQDKEYDAAIEILKKGLEKMNEVEASPDGLNEKLGQINLAKVVDSLNEGDYYNTLDIIQAALNG